MTDVQAIAQKWANDGYLKACGGVVVEVVTKQIAGAIEEARSHDKDLFLTIVSILVANRPGAAINAVTEDYPEVAKLISGVLREREAALAALRKIADWPFDIMGDCVGDARKLALAALVGAPVVESQAPQKRMMSLHGGTPHEECPECCGVCDEVAPAEPQEEKQP